jgi:uncharacterized membrane protein YoaT (DUF817 family)
MTTAAALPLLVSVILGAMVLLAVLLGCAWREAWRYRARVNRWQRETVQPEGPS